MYYKYLKGGKLSLIVTYPTSIQSMISNCNGRVCKFPTILLSNDDYTIYS